MTRKLKPLTPKISQYFRKVSDEERQATNHLESIRLNEKEQRLAIEKAAGEARTQELMKAAQKKAAKTARKEKRRVTRALARAQEARANEEAELAAVGGFIPDVILLPQGLGTCLRPGTGYFTKILCVLGGSCRVF